MSSEVRSLGPIERVLVLRTLPLFGSMPTEDLGAIAEWTVEREFAPGQTLLEEGAPVESIHILIRGTSRVSRGDQAFRVFGPRDAVGVIGLLSRDERGVRAVALERCATLELRRRPLLRMFEERFEIFEHLLREVARLLIEERGASVESGAPRADREEPAREPAAPTREAAQGMDLVDRMLWLRAALPFAMGHPLAVAELARMVVVRCVPAGEVVEAVGDPADTIVIPVSGVLVAAAPGKASVRAAAGTALGLTDGFAGQGYRLNVVAEEPSTLLVVRHESVLDAFENHPSLALDCLAELASELLAAFMQRAEAEPEVPRGLGGGRPVPAPPVSVDPMREAQLLHS